MTTSTLDQLKSAFAALQGLLDLIDWVGLEPSRDVPLHEWEAISESAITEARRVLRETNS